jgi:hypothetical protein
MAAVATNSNLDEEKGTRIAFINGIQTWPSGYLVVR